MPIGLEQLQQRAQMRRRERGAAAVGRVMTVDKVMHAPTEIVCVQLSDVRSMQNHNPDQGNYLVTS